MICRHIRQEDQHMAPWAGGCTCQLAIWPPEAQYAGRNFLWRISAAEATVEESDYTSLPDYERLLCTTSGTIRLQHGEKPPVLLAPYEIHHFDGGIPTHSWGQCKDFNLMFQKGHCRGSMEALSLANSKEPILLDTRKADWLLLYCVFGKVYTLDKTISVREALLLTRPENFFLTGDAGSHIMIVRIWADHHLLNR